MVRQQRGRRSGNRLGAYHERRRPALPAGIGWSCFRPVVRFESRATGSGTILVADGASFTADRIVQQALIIGGTAARLAFVEIVASDINGNPLDPRTVESNAVEFSDSTASSAFSTPNFDGNNLRPTVADNGANSGSDTRAAPEPPSLILVALGLLAL